MKTITYKIEFFSNWHCGSGLAAGADVDAIVIKDSESLPFVPGRTMKGLLRDAAENLYEESEIINQVFGISGDKDEHHEGKSYFTNAVLSKEESKYIVSQNLTRHLYQTFASTAIDENGIAKDNSLRKIETVVPCTLQGHILNVPDEAVSVLENAAKMIKRMGTGRNRGYGRCCIKFTKVEEKKEEHA